MAFRLQTKNFFLTYPDADFDNQVLCDFLWNKLSSSDPAYIVVSREYHKYPQGHEQEGQEDLNRPHHHALIILGKKKDIKNARFFDFSGKHCNIQQAPREGSTLPQCRNYTIKDGLFYERGELPANFDDNGTGTGRKRNSDEAFQEALAEPTKEGFLEKIRTKAPRDYIIMHDKITSFAAKHYAPAIPDFTTGYTIDNFILPEALSDWYSTYFLVRASTLATFQNQLIVE